MTDDNIVSIVQVPDTFFENNNRDDIALFDDLAKVKFHLLKKHQRMLHEIVHFYAESSISNHFPINNRGNVSGHSFRLYGMSDLGACVHGLAITNMRYLYPF